MSPWHRFAVDKTGNFMLGIIQVDGTNDIKEFQAYSRDDAPENPGGFKAYPFGGTAE
jgi:hypothetical protein